MSIFLKAYIDIFKGLYRYFQNHPRAQGVYKLGCIFNILHCSEMENQIQFGSRCCQKYELYEKTLEIKIVEHWIPYTKVSERTCLSPPGVELRSSTDWYVTLYWNGKVDSVWCLTQPKLQIEWENAQNKPKIRIVWENAHNKSCWASNSTQKSHWAYNVPKYLYYFDIHFLYRYLCYIDNIDAI